MPTSYVGNAKLKSAKGVFDCTCFKAPNQAQFPRVYWEMTLQFFHEKRSFDAGVSLSLHRVHRRHQSIFRFGGIRMYDAIS